ncbi:hypothetical protein K2173_001159 [Erythroxylum novogranatense]|uniref:Sodium channel modifier 1 n=1 Tax=Erythroxylum novogranatense TaxID=1862640 RepID=A0AAV8TKI1_9ROSI|nr:hypothetical protein K2173_001159 [Erythroxylum novogranatense]
MSVFGGDSWAREAQHRKRRVEEKLSNGKFTCLVCPHNPVLDSLIMLNMHRKGSRHLAAESRLKERELSRQNEISKRLALSDPPGGSNNSGNSSKRVQLPSKPLIDHTRKAASEALCKKLPQESSESQKFDAKSSQVHVKNAAIIPRVIRSYPATQASSVSHTPEELDLRARRDRELKFIEAGWKRDCHGRWFKDENVEFDSDEEDPNVCLG